LLRVIQAFGLTSDSRKDLSPAVDDVSFEAHAGRITALLGTAGAGKTTTLRLMLELQQGRGITYFKGRPLHRIPHPAREVGVLLGDVPGHPSRTVRGHLRMLCAAAGLPARRADEVLEAVGLVSLREERLGTLSRGVDRRLGLACLLLSDPHTLILDNPAEELSVRESRWLHGMLRAHATQGGTVLFTTSDPKEAARTADRVVTLDRGRLVCDQEVTDFARNRLRARVAVRSPHAARLAALLTKEARTAHRSVEVVREDGNRLSVYGSTCADVGDTAFRHGILIHQLADEVGDMGPGAGTTTQGAAQTGDKHRTSAASTATERRQAPFGAPFAGQRGPAGVRQLADAHNSAGAALPASAAATASTAARAADARAAGRAEDADITARPEDAPDTTVADGASVNAVSGSAPVATCPVGSSSARHPEGALGTAEADGGSSPAGAEACTGPRQTESRALAAGAGRPAPTADDPPAVGVCDGLDDPGRPAASVESDRAPGSGDTDSKTGSGISPVITHPEIAHATSQSGKESHREAAPNEHAQAEAPDRAVAAPMGSRSARFEPTRSAATRPATAQTATTPPATTQPSIPTPRPAEAVTLDASSALPPPISVRSGPSPLRPLRYELRRAAGIGTGFVTGAVVLAVSALTALLMGRLGHAPQPRVVVAWPQQLPLPPAALGAGLLGALAFGDEFRHPALAVDRGTVPRRLGLLTAKLLVAAATALMLAFLTVGCDAEVLYVVYGRELAQVPGDWLSLGASWLGLVVGCAWAGVLAAGLFRSTTAGLAVVVAVPVVVVPLVQKALGGEGWSAAGLSSRLRQAFLLQWPFGGERYLEAAARVIAQPVGGALTLSLVTLLCAYLLTTLRSRVP
jgi:ABC-type multidrug transport system ATPase subunit